MQTMTPEVPTSVSLERAVALLREDGARRLEARANAVESMPLHLALGRILASDLHSACDHPNVDDSSLDGVACRISDTQGATKEAPRSLTLIGESAAGRPFGGTLGTGEAVWIQTGAAVPEGADGIVAIEDTHQVSPRQIEVRKEADAGAIRRRGQDVRTGDVGLQAGRRLDASCLALAAAMGHATVPVRRPLRVAMLTSGDEVVPPGGTLGPGDVFDANGPALEALLWMSGVEVVTLPTVKDRAQALLDAITELSDIDLLVTSGAISMGRYDHVRDLLLERGNVVFRKVMLKPGGPSTFAVLDGVPWLALPGNPVSSTVTFLALARPWIDAALGNSGPSPLEERIPVRAGDTLRAAGAKTTLLRVRLEFGDREVIARSTGSQNSGIVRSLADANALAFVPPSTVYEPGDLVQAIPLKPHLG